LQADALHFKEGKHVETEATVTLSGRKTWQKVRSAGLHLEELREVHAYTTNYTELIRNT
jgi:hypothetical protein